MQDLTLSDEYIRTIKLPERGKILKIHDTVIPELYLRITFKGRKTWYVKCQVDDQTLSANLGRYPSVDLKHAQDYASFLLRGAAEQILERDKKIYLQYERMKLQYEKMDRLFNSFGQEEKPEETFISS